MFISSHAAVISYGVRPPKVNSEYSIFFIYFFVTFKYASKPLEATFKIGNVNVECKFTNKRQKLLNIIKEIMHQQFVIMSETMLCMMQNKLQYRSSSQESDHNIIFINSK